MNTTQLIPQSMMTTLNESMTTAGLNETLVVQVIIHNNQEFVCKNDTPTAQQLLHGELPGLAIGFLAALTVCMTLSLAVYFEEVVFLLRNFERGPRLNRTIWILAFFPGFVLTSFVAVLIPRAGPLCDLVSNVFFVTCLYQFLLLMEDYLGGESGMWELLGESRHVSLNTPPCCCCCFCLPKRIMNRKSYLRLSIVVGQVTVVRTVLAFIAAVLWVNGNYIPGNLLPNNAFLYIATMNLISTLFAMWGLMVMKAATRPDLEKRFAISGKFGCIQLSIISIAVVNIVTGILVTAHIIKCTAFFPSKSRAEAIYHAVVVFMMFLYGLIARYFFRRQSDSRGCGSDEDGKTFATTTNVDNQHETNNKHNDKHDDVHESRA